MRKSYRTLAGHLAYLLDSLPNTLIDCDNALNDKLDALQGLTKEYPQFNIALTILVDSTNISSVDALKEFKNFELLHRIQPEERSQRLTIVQYVLMHPDAFDLIKNAKDRITLQKSIIDWFHYIIAAL